MVIDHDETNAHMGVCRSFDLARAVDSLAVTIEKQSEHSARRILCGAGATMIEVAFTGGDFSNHLNDEVREIIVGDPIAEIRR